MTAGRSESETTEARRRPRGAVRDGLVAAGLELARAGGPDAVGLREATRMVGVVPNAAYRHFADRDELLAAVCTAAMRELAGRMADRVARVRGKYGDPAAAGRRMEAIGKSYLEFAREEPGLFATAFALPQQHAYGVTGDGTGRDRMPLDQLRAALDELADAGVLDRRRRDGIEYPVWSAVHGLAVLTGQGPLRETPDATWRRLEKLTLAFIGAGLSAQYDAPMPSRTEIVRFDDSRPPAGASPWVDGARPGTGIDVTDPDPAWPRQYAGLAAQIREALGWRVMQLEHVGSTSVPGLAAKPIIDIDLMVADPGREQDYVPALTAIGFRLVIREPWWYGHRMLRADGPPACNLHVFGVDSPELIRNQLFRDWLRGNPADRDRYAAAKREAASAANAGGEHVMQYNARKEQVIREIYHRAFTAAGLLEP